MMPIGSSSFTVPDRAPFGPEGPETGPVVVWLRGEHDLSTDDALCATLARAIASDRASLVLDLSEVEFMAPSTLGVIVRAREFLRGRSLSLTVRSPSARARRAMDACRLNDLLGPAPKWRVTRKGARSVPGWQCRGPRGTTGRPPRPLGRLSMSPSGPRWPSG